MSGRDLGGLVRAGGLAAAGLGLLAVGTAAGVGAERLAVGRLRSRPDPQARESFGNLPGRSFVVRCDDGVPLHVEETGPADAPLTIVFSHGYTNALGVWHYQRKALEHGLTPPARLVFYDQRAHGRSGRGAPEHATIDQLGADLRCVLEQRVPTGPVILVGHSMGGMTLMALGDAHPELFGTRVIGVALVSTSTGKLAEVTLGFPATFGRIARQVLPIASRGVQWRPDVVERGRRVGTDLAYLATRRFAFGGRDVSPAVVEYTERMTASTPVDVIAEFYATFVTHDKEVALAELRRTETLVVVGTEDVMTPPEHSRRMAEALPDAALVEVAGAGHMLPLERPALLTLHLRALVARAWRRHQIAEGARGRSRDRSTG